MCECCIVCSDIVVEEVEKNHCCKYRGHKGLEMFRGDGQVGGDMLRGKGGQN